jgi:hypothetical protein
MHGSNRPGLRRIAVTLAIMLVGAGATAGAGARTSTDDIQPCPPPTEYSFFVVYDPCGQTTYDWGVEPPYVGTYYASEEEAAAAEGTPGTITLSVALPTWRNTYDWPTAGHGYVGVHAGTSVAGAYGMQANLGSQHGAWLWPVGDRSYGPGYAEWTYSAPGTTRIAKASVSYAYRNKLLAHHCLRTGLRTADTSTTSFEHCKPIAPPDSQRDVSFDLADPAQNPTSKELYFRVAFPPCADSTSPSCTKYIPALDPLSTGGYARLKRLDLTLVDDDKPVVTASARLWDLGYDYTRGGISPLTVTASDGGAGISRIWVERVGVGEIAARTSPCDPTHRTTPLDNRICPATDVFTTSVDLDSLPEGTAWFVVKARDVAGNVGSSDAWPVYIDRTAPAVASAFEEFAYETATGEARILWTQGADADLPDGAPGSGSDLDTYRWRRAGSTWSGWVDTEEGGFNVTGLIGDSVEVEVRTKDLVGNESAAAAGSVLVVGKPLPPEEEILYPPDDNPPVAGLDGPEDDPNDETDPFAMPSSFLSFLDTHRFDRAAARRYAYRYVGSSRPCPPDPPDRAFCEEMNGGYNHDYVFFRFGLGGDCTNFVSQVMQAAGWEEEGGWYRARWNWWHDKSMIPPLPKASWSWAGAPNFLAFALSSGRAHVLYSGRNPWINGLNAIADLQWGDVVQLDLDSSDNKRQPTHSLVVTGRTPVRVTYHSVNRKDKLLRTVINAGYAVNWVWLVKVHDTYEE